MAEDVIAWDKIDSIADDVHNVAVDMSTDMKRSMDSLVNNVDASLSGITAGIPAARMFWLASESVSNGIKLTYKVNVGSSLDGRTPSKDATYNYDLANLTKGVMVRYKTSGYPLNKSDGTLAFVDEDVFTVSAEGELVPREKTSVVTGLSSNTKYYFTAFPYSTYGAYNEQLGTSNCTTCTYSSNKGAVRVHIGLSGYHNKPLGEYKVTLTGSSGTFTQQGKGDADFMFNSLNGGNYTLKLSGVKDFVAPPDQTINIVAGQTKTASANYKQLLTLETCTWEDVANISASGQAANTFSVGESKNIRVGSEEITVEIIDFNHDDLQNGGKAGITFAMKNLMANSRRMNASNTNSGGFTGSEMYSWLQNDLLPSLPSDLKSAIKMVNKKTSRGNQNSGINTDAMKLFLFSEKEIFNTNTYSYNGEGYQYPYFATSSRRIKKMANGSGDARNWWLRSPRSGDSTTFCSVDSDGTINYYYASITRGVCFGFCI